MYDKFKGILADDALFYSVLIVLVGVASFGLGRWSVSQTADMNLQKGNEAITYTQQASVSEARKEGTDVKDIQRDTNSAQDTNTQYVGSKNGTKYHLPTCPGAKQIKEENKVYFASKADAQKAGYTPASNCKGI